MPADQASRVSKLIIIIGIGSLSLLVYVFVTRGYFNKTTPNVFQSKELGRKINDFDSTMQAFSVITEDQEVKTKIPDKPTQPYTGYGEGCRENPYRKRFKILLENWEEIASRQNITDYFICFGSMLGQSRNGDAVPYDHDIDICMFRRDLYKLDPEEEKRPFNYDDGTPHLIIQRHCHHPPSNTARQDCDGNVVYSYVDKCAIIDPCARILLGSPPFLDVFAIKDQGKELLDEYKRVKHKREVILPLKPCTLMGIKTKCPNNSTTYLERYYGKNFNDPIYVCKNGKWVRPS